MFRRVTSPVAGVAVLVLMAINPGDDI